MDLKDKIGGLTSMMGGDNMKELPKRIIEGLLPLDVCLVISKNGEEMGRVKGEICKVQDRICVVQVKDDENNE